MVSTAYSVLRNGSMKLVLLLPRIAVADILRFCENLLIKLTPWQCMTWSMSKRGRTCLTATADRTSWRRLFILFLLLNPPNDWFLGMTWPRQPSGRASAFKAGDMGINSHFPGWVYTCDITTGTLAATLPGTRLYRVSAGTGWYSSGYLAMHLAL